MILKKFKLWCYYVSQLTNERMLVEIFFLKNDLKEVQKLWQWNAENSIELTLKHIINYTFEEILIGNRVLLKFEQHCNECGILFERTDIWQLVKNSLEKVREINFEFCFPILN